MIVYLILFIIYESIIFINSFTINNMSAEDNDNDCKKGYIYVIDFNPKVATKIGIPFVNENNKIYRCVKIGRTCIIEQRIKHYKDMNINHYEPRILFLCKTNDCVKLEALFHKTFENISDNENSDTKRELFCVEKSLDTIETLQKKCIEIMNNSNINSIKTTFEIETNELMKMIKNIKNEKEMSIYRHYTIEKSDKKQKGRTDKRTDLFKSKKITIKQFFKNNKYLDEPDDIMYGNSEKNPTKYKPKDLYWDLKENNIILIKPTENDINMSTLTID